MPDADIKEKTNKPTRLKSDEVESLLKAKTELLMQNINEHISDPNHPSWANLTSSGFKHYGAVFQSPDNPSPAMDLSAYLESLDYVVSQYPEYRLKVVDSVYNISVRKGTAQGLLNMELLGAPEGVVRNATTHVEWLRVSSEDEGADESWHVVWVQSFGGMKIA